MGNRSENIEKLNGKFQEIATFVNSNDYLQATKLLSESHQLVKELSQGIYPDWLFECTAIANNQKKASSDSDCAFVYFVNAAMANYNGVKNDKNLAGGWCDFINKVFEVQFEFKPYTRTAQKSLDECYDIISRSMFGYKDLAPFASTFNTYHEITDRNGLLINAALHRKHLLVDTGSDLALTKHRLVNLRTSDVGFNDICTHRITLIAEFNQGQIHEEHSLFNLVKKLIDRGLLQEHLVEVSISQIFQEEIHVPLKPEMFDAAAKLRELFKNPHTLSFHEMSDTAVLVETKNHLRVMDVDKFTRCVNELEARGGRLTCDDFASLAYGEPIAKFLNKRIKPALVAMVEHWERVSEPMHSYVDEKGRGIMHIVAEKTAVDTVDTLKMLMIKGFDHSAKSKRGWTVQSYISGQEAKQEWSVASKSFERSHQARQVVDEIKSLRSELRGS